MNKKRIMIIILSVCTCVLLICAVCFLLPVKECVPDEGILEKENLDICVSYANYTDDFMSSLGTAGVLNASKLMISSVRHLPIVRFDTLDQLQRFVTGNSAFSFDTSYDEIPSFNQTVSGYDEAFFEDNSLMLVYVSANSGSYRFAVESVFCDGVSFCIHVERANNPQVLTQDMAGWFVTVAVPDGIVDKCENFDADLINK